MRTLLPIAAILLCCSAHLAAQETPPPDGAGAVEGREAIHEFMQRIAPAAARARESWPSMRERFLAGLIPGASLTVMTIVKDDAGVSEVIDVSVERLANGLIHGHIVSVVAAVQGFREGDEFALPEGLLYDWTVTYADGSGEGNFVGAVPSGDE